MSFAFLRQQTTNRKTKVSNIVSLSVMHVDFTLKFDACAKVGTKL